MEVIFCISMLIIGALAGWWAKSLRDWDIELKRNKKVMDNVSKQYLEILENIRCGKCKFKSRINKTVYIRTNIGDHGEVDVVYMMDNKDVAIFKESKCIYASNPHKETISDIIKSIRIKFGKEINDTVDVMGITFSKNEFERMLGINSQVSQNTSMGKVNEDQKSDIDKIIENNNNKLSLDSILDRIGEVGYDKLTDKEKEFLKRHNNG